MIEFRQKLFTEYDAMKILYNNLKRDGYWRERVKVINRNSVIPVLRGNNVLIERFVISSNFIGRDKYRLYLKIGAQAKLPDEVRLPEIVHIQKVLNSRIELKAGGGPVYPKTYSETEEDIMLRQKLFDNGKGGKDGKKGEKKNKGGGGEQYPQFSGKLQNFDSGYDISYEIRELLGDAIKYDKRDRSLVLEFDGPSGRALESVKEALNILPFGLDYNLYLLDA